MTDFRSQLKDRQKILLYTLLGVIWSLSNVGYVKFFGSMFAWFTFAPVIFFLKNEKTHDGIKYSAICGFAAYLVHFWWLVVPVTGMTKTFGLPEWSVPLSFLVALIIFVGLSFLSGLNYTLCYAAAKFLGRNKSFLFYFGFAVSGTVFDYFYPKIWADYLGYSQYQTVNIIQSVDLFGISYVTFLIMLVNSLLAYAAETVFHYFQTEKSPRSVFSKCAVTYGIAVFSLIIITAIYGSVRLDFVNSAMKAAKKVSIGVVQGNISGAEKKRMNSSEMINTYRKLSSELSNERPELIVWPESAVPIWFDESQTDFSRVNSHSLNNSLLLFGGHARRDNGPGVPSDIFNSLFLVDSNGEKIESYYKNKLLPFTERAPVRFLSFVFPMMGLKEFSPGEGPRFIEHEGFKIAVNVCYEAIIPEYIRKSIRNEKGESANIIINCTNDSWFGRTIEPEMHLRIATIRAIENRRCLVRATCTGYSVVTDANGFISYRSHLYKPESHAEKVPLLEIKSFYTSYGWLFIYLLGLLFVCWIAATAYCRLRFYLKFTRREKHNDYIKRRRDVWMR